MPERRLAKKEQAKAPDWYVMFGFNKADDTQVGYFSHECSIAEDLCDAKRFPTENVFKVKGFGTPQQWLELINSDKSLNKGYKFHLVKTTLSA